MSKNKTRKGLAFGAGLSLVASGFAGLPAQADGITGFIPLAPATGPATALAVEANDGETFSLQASPAGSVMGSGNVKFLVEDSHGKLLPGANSTGAASRLIADDATAVINHTDDYVSIQLPSSLTAGTYLAWVDKALNLDGGSADQVVLPADTLVQVFSTGDYVTFKSSTDLTSGNAVNAVDVASGLTMTFVGGSSLTFDSSVTVADNEAITVDATAETISAMALTDFGLGNGTYIMVPTGAALHVDKASDSSADIDALVRYEPALVTISTGSNAAFKVDANLTSTLDAVDVTTSVAVMLFQVPTAVRAADNSYVVDSGQSTAGNQPVLELVATENDVTRASTVTAFIDLFADREIGASEYASAPVDVTFVAQEDLVVTTVLDAPDVGEETLTAKIRTVPVLNEEQLGNNELIRAVFTRQGSATKAISAAATQDNTTLAWSVSVDLGSEASTITEWVDATTAITGTTTWAGFTEPVTKLGDGDTSDAAAANDIVSIALAANGVVTVTTGGNHGLLSGDKITMAIDQTASTPDLAVDAASEATARTVTVTGEKTFTYAITETAAQTAATVTDLHSGTTYKVATYVLTGGDGLVDRVFAGDYSATAALEQDTADKDYKLFGTASAKGTLAATADDVVFTTTASASVQGIEDNGDAADTTNGDLLVKAGTTTLTVTATVLDEDDAAVGAGRNVAISMTNRSANVTVNGLKVAQDLVTDANGQVTLTVASTTGVTGEKVDIKAIAEGVAGSVSEIRVLWATAGLQVADLNTTDASISDTQKRTIPKNGSYDVALFITDQWYTPADADTYRVKVSGEGVTGQFLTLTAGKANFTVTDTGVKADYNSVITLQKKSTTGVWADTTTVVTLRNLVEATPGILVDADGASLYGSAAADLSDAVAKVAVVERDTRVANVAQPAYVNAVTVNGKVVDTGSNVGQDGAVVTISGPSNILFSYGSVDKRGSLTFVAGQSGGAFTVNLYSTTAQKDTVITIASAGVTKEVKVTFTGIGVGEGTSLVVTAPANVMPASTFQVKAKLADTFGNGVDTAAGRVKVTYTGPGIIFGTLPTETDANGELQFSVLLGANDTGSVSVTVSYDQNGDADYVDAKDLNTSATIAIGAAATSAKVNAGSFKGYVALYARGYEGKRMSAKVGKDWVVVPALASNFERVVEFTGAGVSVSVQIYIDRVLVATIPLVTK